MTVSFPTPGDGPGPDYIWRPGMTTRVQQDQIARWLFEELQYYRDTPGAVPERRVVRRMIHAFAQRLENDEDFDRERFVRTAVYGKPE